MQKIFKLLIFLFLAIYIEPVLAYNCEKPDNPYLPGDENNAGVRSEMASGFKYDITQVTVKDGWLYILGWAFKPNQPQTIGQAPATLYLRFINVNDASDIVGTRITFASPGTATCSFKGCNNDPAQPKYYDLTFWNCHRQNAASGNACLSNQTVSLKGGFSGSASLNSFKPGQTYKLQMYSGLRSEGTWIDVGATKEHIDSSIINGFEGSDKKFKFVNTSSYDTITSNVGSGRVMGPSGFHNTSPAVTVLGKGCNEAAGVHFTNNHKFSIVSNKYVKACRGGSVACGSSSTGYSAGTIELYPVDISQSNSTNIGSISGGVGYMPALWFRHEESLKIKVEDAPKEVEPGDPWTPNPNACVGKEVFSIYYLFLHSAEFHAYQMVSSAYSANRVGDDAIINQLTSGKGWEFVETKGKGVIRVDDTHPTKDAYMSLRDFHDFQFKRAFNDNLVADVGKINGNQTFVIKGKGYMSALSDVGTWIEGQYKCSNMSIDKIINDSNYLSGCTFNPNSSGDNKFLTYMGNHYEDWKSLAIQPLKKISIEQVSGYKGQVLKINRSYADGYQFMSDGRVINEETNDFLTQLKNSMINKTGTSRVFLQQPVAYRWDICLKGEEEEVPPPSCSDSIKEAKCNQNGNATLGSFHESDDLKTCTLNSSTQSGFTMISSQDTNNYCSVACKDDIDIKAPTHKSAAAGGYFVLNKDIPEVKGTRTCVTSKIDYNKYDNDLTNLGNAMIEAYNEYKDFEERLNTLNSLSSTPHTQYFNAYCRRNCSNCSSYCTNTSSSCTNCSSSCKQTDSMQLGLCKARCNSIYAQCVANANSSYNSCVSSCNSSYNSCLNSGTHYSMPYTYYTYEVPNQSNRRSNATRSNSLFNSQSIGGGGTASMSCVYDSNNYTSTAYPNNWNSFKQSVATGKTNAKNKYDAALQKYKDAINSFAKCFSWTDNAPMASSGESYTVTSKSPDYNKYKYGFDPDVTFDYPDEDKDALLMKNGPLNYKTRGLKKESDRKTTTYYWNNSREPDNKFNTSTSVKTKTSLSGDGYGLANRNFIRCAGKDKCTTSSTISGKTYPNTSYIKRVETVTYTYNLPRVDTLIPSGAVVPGGSTSKLSKPLEKEAVPVNVNTKGGTYDYVIKVSNVTDNTRKNANQKGRTLEAVFGNSKAFKGKNSKTSLGYKCDYKVINDIYIPPDNPSNPQGGRLNYFYRPVDTLDINHPKGALLGYNWSDTRGTKVQEQIRKDAENYQELISEKNGKFNFRLTPTVMKQVRYYNATQSGLTDSSFADFNLYCKDEGSTYHCYSPFLSCLASRGTNDEGKNGTKISSCRTIFGNTLNNYKDTFTELKRNRENLISKMDRLNS